MNVDMNLMGCEEFELLCDRVLVKIESTVTSRLALALANNQPAIEARFLVDWRSIVDAVVTRFLAAFDNDNQALDGQ